MKEIVTWLAYDLLLFVIYNLVILLTLIFVYNSFIVWIYTLHISLDNRDTVFRIFSPLHTGHTRTVKCNRILKTCEHLSCYVRLVFFFPLDFWFIFKNAYQILWDFYLTNAKVK